MKFLNNIDLNRNQILNAVIQNLATPPSNPVKGLIYFNTTDNKYYGYDGSRWVELGLSGGPYGDMFKSVYDTDNDGIVDKAERIDDGTYSATAQDIKDAVDKRHTHSNKALLDTYTQTEADLADAVAKKHAQNTDTGTSSQTFQIGSSGPKLKNNSGELQVRNSADTDYADLRVKNLYVEGTTTTINANEVNIGDNIIKLNADITSSDQNSDGGIEIKRLTTGGAEGNASIYFDEASDIWKLKDGAPESLQTFAIARKYVATIGDGTNTTYTITHNMNTRDVTVTIRETNSPYGVVLADVECTTTNSITVRFATAPSTNQYTVVIVG